MANITHFMIPADDAGRAAAFYSSVFGWKITPVHDSPGMPGMDAMQYHAVTTGPATAGSLNSGGLYRRHGGEPLLAFAEVDNVDRVAADVEKSGGKITMPATAIPGVGIVAMILDTEGNLFGIWKPLEK